MEAVRGQVLLRAALRTCIAGVLLAALLALTGCQQIRDFLEDAGIMPAQSSESAQAVADAFDPSMVPAYSGAPSVAINGNNPFFTADDLAREAFEEFAPLDELGRCGAASALVCADTMPTTHRGSIGMIRPSGWQVARYPWVDGEYLFNRCHLIGYQLTGQNDNELNLITGTRSMNVVGMQPYESQVANYIWRNGGNHVLYRVTPVFTGSNLVADGVLIEAQSIEDRGRGVRFCVWCYNVEPGVTIDYATGKSEADGTISASTPPATNVVVAPSREGEIDVQDASDATVEVPDCDYVLNTGSLKFHRPDCPSAADMKEHNKQYFYGTREEAIELGYTPCGVCKP